MKILPVMMLCLIGFTTGWLIPHPHSQSTAKPNQATKSQRKNSSLQRKREALLSSLLEPHEFQELQKETATFHFDILESLEDSFDYSSDDVDRIVEVGAEDALQKLLTDPAADSSLCKDIAMKWASQDAGKALRFFLNQSSYRADDCLAALLPQAFTAEPDLVVETIRSKPRAWKLRHLNNLMTGVYRVRTSPDLQETPTDDPFADDNSWISKPLGPEILEAFLDPDLKDKALSYLEPKPPSHSDPEPTSEDPQPDISWDDQLSSYHSSHWGTRSQLYEAWRKNETDMLSKTIEHGNFEARQFAINHLSNKVSREQKEWPTALKKLEEHIEALGVIPQHPPGGYPAGPYLVGEVPAKWIAKQSPALQRTWTPDFVETWAQREPAEAINWALTLDQSPHRDLAIQKGLIIWAHQTPAQARGFVESLPPGNLRESSISNAAASWSRVDPESAREWLQSLPKSPGKQRALERFK